jgi:hypothetical protein
MSKTLSNGIPIHGMHFACPANDDPQMRRLSLLPTHLSLRPGAERTSRCEFPRQRPPRSSSTRRQPLLQPSVPPAEAPSSIKLHPAELAHSALRCSPVAASRARARWCSPASARGRRSSRLTLNGAHWPAPAASRAHAQRLSGSASGAGDWRRLGAARLASGSYGRHARGQRAGQQS